MFVFALFAIITLFFYMKMKFGYENENVLQMTTFLIGITTAIAFVLLVLSEDIEKNIYWLCLIPLFIFGIYYIKKRTKPKEIGVIANQQRYYDDIKARDIVNFYSVRKEIKPNRIEVLVNKEGKKLMKDGEIVPQFFIDYLNFSPTKIKSLEDINENFVFKVVFDKVKSFIKAKESSVDYQKVLEENDYIAEFFLMNLWESHTKQFNIGVMNLDILAQNDKDREFIGALDLLNLNSVKRKGAVLFYKYIEFKGRIKDFME